MQRHFLIATFASLLVGFCSIYGAAQSKEYALGIRVIGKENGSLVSGAKIQIRGSGIFEVRGADDVTIDERQGAVMHTRDDGIGMVMAFLKPGTYLVTVSHRFYRQQVVSLTIPDPQRAAYETTYSLLVKLEKPDGHDSRKLTITVLGEKFDRSGNSITSPLGNAKVIVNSDETEMRYTRTTDRQGVVVLDRPLVIGTEVSVSASAPGYSTSERKLIIGSFQEMDPNNRRTSTSDQMVIKLQEKQPDFSLVVEAVNARTRAAVPGARVVIELIGNDGGAQVAASSTDRDGRTKPMSFPLPVGEFSKHAQYRAKVSASGYKEKWSDIPNEIPYLGGAGRGYVVHLDPITDVEAGGTENAYDLPAPFKNKTVVRVEKLDPILECWVSAANHPCSQPNMEAQITIYHFGDGSNFWDRRDYDNKRRQMAQNGMSFRWACGKSLWRNGRCG